MGWILKPYSLGDKKVTQKGKGLVKLPTPSSSSLTSQIWAPWEAVMGPWWKRKGEKTEADWPVPPRMESGDSSSWRQKGRPLEPDPPQAGEKAQSQIPSGTGLALWLKLPQG